MHEDDKRFRLFVFHDERLDDAMFVDTQLPRRFGGAAVLDIIVGVFAEADVMAPQELRRLGLRDMFGFAHRRIVSASAPLFHAPLHPPRDGRARRIHPRG
jgi:hypothetical protein